jgi:Holliday junction resolvase RusA-like endonuclease
MGGYGIMAGELLRVTLPMPPTTNNLYVNAGEGHGRRVSPTYERWRWQAKIAVAEWPDLSAYAAVPWAATIAVYGLPRGSDLDNRIKATLDLIASLTGLHDDYNDEIAALRTTTGKKRVVAIVNLIEPGVKA